MISRLLHFLLNGIGFFRQKTNRNVPSPRSGYLGMYLQESNARRNKSNRQRA